MAIGRTFPESLQKVLRSMETGLTGLNEIPIEGSDATDSHDAARAALAKPSPDRLLVIAQAFRLGLSLEEIQRISRFDPWFLAHIQDLVNCEETVRRDGLPVSAKGFSDLKKQGFSDARLAELVGRTEEEVSAARRGLGVRPTYKRIDTCAAEFPSRTPYMYSAYEGYGIEPAESESEVTDKRKIIILGGGPNRIGQGIEFDYCCVHAVYGLREAGYETIMVNCNPETVSTDYDTSDRLYFEPLTAEDVIEIVREEQQRGELLGVIVQFGGQTPLKLAAALEAANIPILGTPPDAIDLAEDRERFQQVLSHLGLKQPANGIAYSIEQAETTAEKLGYPVLLRPSYVLGGRAMEIVHDRNSLHRYMAAAVKVSGKDPVLIDSYLQDAIEVDVDALADGESVHVAGIMEHIEEAGIHSGDSACSLPPFSLRQDILHEIGRQTEMLANGLSVVGLMNIQFAIKDDEVYILEVNPRASRTVPFVAKATGLPIAKIAARIMAGEKLASFDLRSLAINKHVAVKEAVFPFARFPGVDVLLGPEMKSTGEVMGLDTDFGRAYAKSQIGCGNDLPLQGAVFISVRDRDKPGILQPARQLAELGFKIVATSGTARFLADAGLEVKYVNKVLEGRPHIVDSIKNGQIQLIFNTTEGPRAIEDSFTLRQTALYNSIPYSTTVAGAIAMGKAIAALRAGELEVAPLQSYFRTSF
jgi:carbamoyl-phosphate synthase large subunit